MTIGVCIATYLRPVMLSRLLQSLAELEFDGPSPDIVVVVVDNDASGSAEQVLRDCRRAFPWPILTAVEPTRNIAMARNRCVAMALAAQADWLAFVDDDEEVTPRWLAELLRAQAAHDVEVVAGPVVSAYPPGTPQWVVAAGLPLRLRLRDGAVSPVAETANALVSRRLAETIDGPFDPRFGRSGGSDSHFFLRARQAGARIVWASEAVVRETVPVSRAKAGWFLRRAFRVGNAGVHVARAISPFHAWFPRRFAAAWYRIALGTLSLLPALPRGRGHVVRSLENVFLGVGALVGMTGVRFVEYNQPHGG